MSESNLIDGLHDRWQILEKLAEGDTGEVFRAVSLRAGVPGVFKRPAQSGLPGEIERQAAQITGEARVLKALGSLPPTLGVRIPRLLDESIPGSGPVERTFLVTEQAQGASLAALARAARFGTAAVLEPAKNAYKPPGEQTDTIPALSGEARSFLEAVARSGAVPALVVLRALRGLLALFETVHSHPTLWFDSASSGVVWNDVKPGHLFWDPAEAVLWVIDWGNARFLGDDLEDPARAYEIAQDYHQFLEEMGRYLAENCPDLHAGLDWPAELDPEGQALASLRESVSILLSQENAALEALRGQEAYLAGLSMPGDGSLEELAGVQSGILQQGELPNYPAAIGLRSRYAASLVHAGRLEDFRRLCLEASATNEEERAKWEALEAFAGDVRLESDARQHWQAALQAGLAGEWPAALWEAGSLTLSDPDSSRWARLSALLRPMASEIDPNAETPLTAMHSLLESLEAAAAALSNTDSSAVGTQEQASLVLDQLASLSARLKNEILKKWPQPDPLPPGCGLSYQPALEVLEKLGEALPAMKPELSGRLAAAGRALYQPQAQVEIFMDAWQGRGFKTARQSLRNLLLWDPDRKRVFTAAQAIEAAPAWLDELSSGPQKGERLVDFAIRMEFQGRELRSKAAPARWLESALAVLGSLRGSRSPADLIEENPQLTAEFPWLRKFRRPPPVQVRAPASITAGSQNAIRESKLGPQDDLQLAEALDTWAPEARGSSARVFLGYLNGQTGGLKSAAIKLMRPDKIDYALPLFWEEAQVLSAMQDVPGVVKWLECGFIHLEGEQELPHESRGGSAHDLTGRAVRLKPQDAGVFLGELEDRAGAGWLPYLALEKKNHEDNLMPLCDAGYTQGGFLDLETGLLIAIQLCEILQAAHDRRVVYRDHKILHYYWNPAARRTSIIDWNVSRFHPDGLPEGETRLDLVQFGARALHHIFTGRPAPGALPAGPTMPQEIEAAPDTYTPAWTYDDQQRLPPELRQVISAVLAGAYDRAGRLREDLLVQCPA